MRENHPRRRRVVDVTAVNAGKRLDRVLADALPDLSRTRTRALIEAGSVAAGGVTITEPSLRVKPGQTFVVTLPEAAPPRPQAQAIPLAIRYEDDHLLVVDKPPGLVVHPAHGNPDRTLVNALLAHCGDNLSGIGGTRRPGIVHRLDKGTSGLMVVAKTDTAHHRLSEQFHTRRIARSYLAVVWGVPSPPAGKIEGNIGRNPRNRKKMTVVSRGGKPALTRYRVLRPIGRAQDGSPAASLVECRLATGRTHQVRVHLASIGHPVVGDPLYGRGRIGPKDFTDKRAREAASTLGRQALHANFIEFEHPVSRARLAFRTDLPQDINKLVEDLEKLSGLTLPHSGSGLLDMHEIDT